MSKQKRKEFFEWCKAKKDEGYVFDFKKELKEYCRSDVDILLMKFREDFITLEIIDPFQFITIASVCSTIYRSN